MMVCIRGIAITLLTALLVLPSMVRAADATQSEIDALKRDVEDLRRKLSGSSAAMPRTSVDRALESKYGPNNAVTTRSGKLTISGLLQVWYQGVHNDDRSLFNNAAGSGLVDTFQAQDNDTFRIRRTELKFTMDIHENVTAVVMIDPAREATSFSNGSDPLANSGIFKRMPVVSPEFDAANGPGLGDTGVVAAVQSGSGKVPKLLQDAYINYHGVVPHHDFQVGQFIPFLGEEGIRSSAQLDFAERSFLGQLGNQRDLGVAMHGVWWDDRFQYWLAAFDGAGNYYGSAGDFQNRSDDNDNKDFNYRVVIRPLWKHECWGSLELGMSSKFGKHGEGGQLAGNNPIDNPLPGLNRPTNWAIWHNAFASYRPGGSIKGAWVAGEWAWIKDRNAPGSVVDVDGNGVGDSGLNQAIGKPFRSSGWFIAAGYKISDSRWCDSAPGWLKPFEFVGRYDTFQNVQVANRVTADHTNVYSTRVATAGVNYYIKGHDAKIQANYNWVRNPDGGDAYTFHGVRNDNFIVSFQVAF
ncbi:MAG TPA: porin [Planctomycetota bacterium]|jgi:hypothetical protein